MSRTMTLAATLCALALVLGSRGQQGAWAAEDMVMGIYEGTFTPAKGSPAKAEARVVAEGKGRYRAVLNTLSEGTAQPTISLELRGRFSWVRRLVHNTGRLRLRGQKENVTWTGTISQHRLIAQARGDDGGRFELSRVERRSPTEGLKPPPGAIVLLPFEKDKPTTLSEWINQRWKILPDGSVEVRGGSNRTVRKFGDAQLHVEFMTPYEPTRRGQGRGNSGVYLQNFYEVQVLDSFGLAPKNNECGGIYSIAAPKVNVCFPPLRWQTYDITFRAPRFGPDGQLIKPPTMTVIHNGVKIHDQQVVPRGTERSKPGGEVKEGPIQLQDHGNRVRYRNIWLIELKD